MKRAQRYLIPALVASPAIVGLIIAPSATAECEYSGGATICSQGDVRSSGMPAPSVSGPVYPYPCEDDWLCNDGVDIVFGPIWPDRPGIGGPGGIGPRR